MPGSNFTPQQVNYFVLGWLLVHPNGSSTVVDSRWYKSVDYIQGAVNAYIFDGVPLDGCTPLAVSCAHAVEAAFGRQAVVPKGPIDTEPRLNYPERNMQTRSTTAEPLPEIHHDVVPHSDDKWSSSFTPL